MIAGSLFAHAFLRFCVVGTVGFLTDLLLLYAVMWLGPGAIVARFISAFVALAVTWQLNRRLTFGATERSSLKEGGQYYLVNGIGFGVNMAIYVALIFSGFLPAMALVIASICAMAFNYSGNKYWVFR